MGASTRTRNNSTSTYAGSLRAAKVKARPTKEEKAKEMTAMDNLIAALDESAETERRRKERLVAAAGITDDPPHVRNSKAAGSQASIYSLLLRYFEPLSAPAAPAEVA